MGKAARWFRGLLGLKNSGPNPPAKKKWSFARTHKEKDNRKSQRAVDPSVAGNDDDASRHAIAVAAATAAVAEAAVAAAQAAAAVVRLTGGGACNPAACAGQNGAGCGSQEERAAVTIQSHFRAYLARKALRALKALVKLQALVKGYIYRKRFTENLQQMQAVARAQARARADQVLNSEASNSSTKSSNFNHNSPVTPEKFEHISKSMKHQQLMALKRNGSKSNNNVIYDRESSHSIRSNWMGRKTGERSCEYGSFNRIVPLDDDKILEVDTGKPHIIAPKHWNLFHSSHLSDPYYQSFSKPNNSGHYHHTRVLTSPSSGEVQPFSRQDVEESSFLTAENSPQFYSTSSKRPPLTPTKSDSSRSYVSGYYLDHPNYMAYTESSKAKVRSVSAPKHRPHQYERTSSTIRYSVHGFGNESRPNAQRVSALHTSFTSKAYPGSGRLDKLGMPVRDVSGFSGGHWHNRY